MEKTTINTKGQWLRSNAAASYKRMLAAGMPEGGISSMGAGRTYDEQKALYRAYLSGMGNLAAPPGRSKHETGLALDISRGTPAHTWATQGGVRLQVKSGEKIKANEFGWYRTVPSEAWHFTYIQEKDQRLKALAPAFPLPKGWYFGPPLPLTNIKSVSGVYRYGNDLKKWQTQAKSIGKNIDVTGRYDAKTETVARALQKAAGLAVDGKIGKNTWPLPWKS